MLNVHDTLTNKTLENSINVAGGDCCKACKLCCGSFILTYSEALMSCTGMKAISNFINGKYMVTAVSQAVASFNIEVMINNVKYHHQSSITHQ